MTEDPAVNAKLDKSWRGGLIACAVVVVNVIGCNRSGIEGPSQDSTQADPSPISETVTPQTQLKNHTSRFWHDEEVGRIIESIGHDDAYVFRWKDGKVEASVQFDAGNWGFNSSDVVENTLPEVEGRSDTPVSSGQIIVVLDKRAGEVHECRVVANVDVQDVGMVTVSSEPVAIRLSSSPHYLVSDNMASLSIKDGETEEKFFEVRFAAPSTN